MSDWRLCTLCDREFDLDDPSIEILNTGSNRTTARDSKTGLVHTLTTKSERYRRQAAQEKQNEQ